MALISKCCNRPQARSLRSTQDSVDDLALNQATEKGNVLWAVEQVEQATAGAEKFHGGLTSGHRGTFRGRLGDLDFLTAEKLPNHRHFQFDRQSETGDVAR